MRKIIWIYAVCYVNRSRSRAPYTTTCDIHLCTSVYTVHTGTCLQQNSTVKKKNNKVSNSYTLINISNTCIYTLHIDLTVYRIRASHNKVLAAFLSLSQTVAYVLIRLYLCVIQWMWIALNCVHACGVWMCRCGLRALVWNRHILFRIVYRTHWIEWRLFSF